MERKIVVNAIIVLILSVFIANILLAFIFRPALTSPPSFWEILLRWINNPLVLIPVMGGGLWLILSELGKRETAIPDRYRIYLAFILTIIALLSIQLLSMKVIETTLYPPFQGPSPSQDPIFASALLGIVYLTALPYILPIQLLIPVFVIASAWWAGEKMGLAYPIAYSSVLGFVAGVALPTSYLRFDMLTIIYLTYLLTFVFGIFTVIYFLTKSKSGSANNYFIPSLKVTISLIVFLIMMFATYNYIFQPYYNPLGLTS